MRIERNSEVVYRNGLLVALTGVWAAAFALATFDVVLNDGDALGLLLLIDVVAVPAFAYLMAVRPRVVLRDDDLLIRGHFNDETIPYLSIDGIAFTGRFLWSRWLEIDRGYGWKVGVHPLMADSLPLTDPPWQQGLAGELMKRVSEAKRAAGHG